MNREAAILGTPVCTIFAGALPAVDRCLIRMGRLLPLQTECDVATLRLQKKGVPMRLANDSLCDTLVDWIVER